MSAVLTQNRTSAAEPDQTTSPALAAESTRSSQNQSLLEPLRSGSKTVSVSESGTPAGRDNRWSSVVRTPTGPPQTHMGVVHHSQRCSDTDVVVCERVRDQRAGTGLIELV